MAYTLNGAVPRLSRDCALVLLARSIGFGHGSLAVVRLAIAVEAGAQVADEHWAYCRDAACSSMDARLWDLYCATVTRRPNPGSATPVPGITCGSAGQGGATHRKHP